MKNLIILALVLASIPVSAQPRGGGSTSQTAIPSGPTLPATCQPGRRPVWFKTTTPIGLHQCTAVNTWTQVHPGPTYTTEQVDAMVTNKVTRSGDTMTGPLGLHRVATASLPAAGTPGRLLGLTDGNRGVRYDTGISWFDLLSGIYHPQLFGARCDGSNTDDSAAFMAIHAAMPAGGGTIQMPAGTCAVNAGVLNFTKPVRIVGHKNGSVLRRRTNYERHGVGAAQQFDGATITLRGAGSVMEDVHVTADPNYSGIGGDLPSQGDGILILAAHVQLVRVESNFHRVGGGHGGHGVRVGTAAEYINTNSFRLENVRSSENNGDGIRLESWPAAPDANVGLVDTCFTHNNGGSGLHFVSALYNTVINHTAEGNVGYGYRFGAGAGQNVIIGGDVEGNGGHGTGKQIRFDNLSFTNYIYSPLQTMSNLSFDTNVAQQFLLFNDQNNLENLGIGQYASAYGRFAVNVGPGSGQKWAGFFSDNSGENNASTILLGFSGVDPRLGGAGITSRYNFNVTAQDHTIVLQPRSNAGGLLDSITADPRGNVVLVHTGLPTNATAGFVWLPSMAGAPTGTPSDTYTNREPCVLDRTANKLWCRIGGAWRDMTGSGGGGGNPAFVGAKATRNSNYTTSDSTHTAVPLTAEDFDTSNFHDNSTNPSRITIPAGQAGKYMVTAMITFNTGGGTRRIARLYKNGTGGTVIASIDQPMGASGYWGTTLSTIVDLAEGDYVEVTGWQNTGGSLDIYADSSIKAELSVVRLGS